MRGTIDDNLNVVDEDGQEYSLHPGLIKLLKERRPAWQVPGAMVSFEIDNEDNVISLDAIWVQTTITKVVEGRKAGYWNVQLVVDDDKKVAISTKGELAGAEEGGEVLLGLASQSNRVVWAVTLVKNEKKPLMSLRVEGVPPSTLRLLSPESFSKFEPVFQSQATCKLLKFECPRCNEQAELGKLDTGCPKCKWRVLKEVDHTLPFKPFFHEDTNLVDFLEHTWICPTCDAVVSTFDNDLDRLVCSKCNVIPHPFYYGSEFDADHYQIRYAKKPALETRVSPEKMAELLKSSPGHLSSADIIALGDEGFDAAKQRYADGSCPHCDGDKGCNSEAAGKRVKKFSEWYCLDNPESKRTQNRVRELKLVLDGLPKCYCGPDRTLKAIPRSPYNVFRDLDGDIDPQDRHWNNSKDKARANRAQEITDRAKGAAIFFDPILKKGDDQSMQCHTTPRSAGGCFVSGGNVIPIREFCPTCQCLDELFTLWQGENACHWTEEEYVARFVSSRKELEDRQTSGTEKYLQVRQEKESKIMSWIESIKKVLPKDQ